MSPEHFLTWAAERFPASGAYLRTASLEGTEQEYTIQLTLAAPEALTALWAGAIERELQASSDKPVKVTFKQPDADAQKQNVSSFLETRDKRLAEDVQNAAVSVKKKTEKSGADVLFGRAFSTKPKTMDLLPSVEAEVCVLGEVFAVEKKETRTGDIVLLVDVTDRKGSVRMKLFLRRDKLDSPITKVKTGQVLHIKGKLEWDKFSKESTLLLTPESVQSAALPMRQDTAEEKRVELHLHTAMSEMDALASPEQFIERAAKWGHKAIAITDHGVLHSFPAAMNAGKKHGVKIIYGCEAYFIDDVDAYELSREAEQGRRSFHMILLAQNQTGLRNLYKLVSDAHLDDFYRHPNILRSKLDSLREGLLVGSACEAGMLYRAIVDGRPRERLLEIARYYDFLEIQPVCNNAFMISSGKAADWDTLRDYNRTVVSIADELGLPVVATGDVHFLEPEDEIYRTMLLSVKDMGGDNPTPLYFKTTQEMLTEFSYLGKDKALDVVVRNPSILADRCDEVQPVRSGEYFPTLVGSAEELKQLSYRKAIELYGDNQPPVLTERLNKELESVIFKGYDIIYMAAQKLVQRSLSKGYLVGSRGSVGSSIVAFLSGITEVNALPPHYRCPKCKNWEFPETPEASCGADMPDKTCPKCGEMFLKDGFDIPFATFLGFEADKKPDIDLNFSGEYQPYAHQHTVELFGESKVFRAGTISAVQEKTALGYVKSYMEKRELELPMVEQRRLALGCTGVKRTTGQHPGGVIIVPQEYEIYDFCPVQHPANKKESGIVTTHFDYHAIEENLLKLDLLGHDDPSMIRMLESLSGVDARQIPLDDPDTMSIFTESAVLGFENDPILGQTGACAVPEFGTKFVREMLLTTEPRTFDELIRISGLSHGTDVWKGNQEDLVKSGTATLKEIICARDDIMIYLISMGLERKLAFTIMESVRKGKGLKPEWESEMRRQKVPEWYIGSCLKIKYMFPKAHAVAYVIMAFRIAWFKVHHPLAFYAAFFTIRAVGFDATLMTRGLERVSREMNSLRKKDVRTAKDDELLVTLEVCYEFYRRGFVFAPISLYESDAVKFLPGDGCLRPPFVSLPGLGETAAESIVNCRDECAFVSAEDLRIRCGGKLSATHVECLRELGALGDLPDTTQLSLFDFA